ncbi:MAG: PKD domain-containing protein [Fimbriimonadaceae bacterium]
MLKTCQSVALRFTALLLILAPSLAFAELFRYLPGDTSIGLVAASQTSPALAQGGDKVLVVWTDNRPNPYGSYEYETSQDVYGMRFDSNGNQLDSTPIPIATFQGAQENPKVSWNGTNWLVVFSSTALGGTGYYYQKGLAAVRIAPNGSVLDSHPIQLYGLRSDSGQHWELGTDGNNWVVVCQGTSASNGIVAMRISPNGVVLDLPNRLLVRETYYGRFNFRLAYAGGLFMVVFDDLWVNGQNTTSYVRFDPSLRLLDPVPVRILDHPASAFSSNGSMFYLVSMRQMQSGLVRVNGNRVNTNGQKLDGEGVDISVGFEPQYLWDPFMAWTGTEWRITWGSNSTLRMASVSVSGNVVNPGGIAVPGPQSGPIAATLDGGLQTAWSVFQNNSYDVLGTHILQQGSALDNVDLGIGVPSQLRSDSATNGNGYVVVYRSALSASARLLAQPLSASGNPLTEEPIELATGLNVNGPTQPNIIWTGSSYMAAWGNGATIYAQRLNPDGTKVDASPFVVMNGYFGPADLAVSGDTVLVLGRKAFQNGQVITVFGARVRASDAAVLDPTPLILGGQYVGSPPAVAVLGGKFLVAYHSNVTHDDSRCFTEGVFVPTSGSQGAPFTIHGPFSTAGGNGIFEVGLASNGNVAMMVQSQELTSGVENDMLYRFIDANGGVSGYQNLTPWEGNQYRPKVSWDGRSFVILYQEQKNRTTYWTLDPIDARSDLFGMRVSPDGTILDPNGFVFSVSPVGETDPSVISMNGVSLITGSRMDNSTGRANYRIAYTLFGAPNNQYPVAVATATPNGGDVPLSVAFSSAGSVDPDGSIASIFWDFGDGTSSTDLNPAHQYAVGVPYIATLTVTDNAGANTVQAILVWATPANKLPIAVGVATPWFGMNPLDVVFSAELSYDPDGFLGNINWRFGDDQSEYWGSTAYHTFYSRGIWPVDLTVWDSRNATGTSRLYVVVGPSATYVPNSVSTTWGIYRGGDASSLGASDDNAYVIEEGPSLNQQSPSSQLDAGFTIAQSNIQGFVLRVEAFVTALPAAHVRQKVYAWNVGTGIWDQLDDRPASGSDAPYELAIPSNGARYVDQTTKTIKVRLGWYRSGVMANRGWRSQTDHLRLTVLNP